MSSRGFLVCADLTGYTAYLSASELEHASGVLGDLLRLLLAEVHAPLRLSRVEGDAVISYATGDGFQGQLVVDRIDDSYVAFRRALDQMVHNTTCTCNACANIASLDLKFVVHHGEFAVQRLGSQDELVGPEVNLLFRLAKNRVRQSLGLHGYAAFTEAALAALDLPGFTEGLVTHFEEDPERGAVTLRVRDLSPVWEAGRDRVPIVIPDGERVAERSQVVAAPIDEVFAMLTDPRTRTVIFEADGMTAEGLDGGRLGVDSVYVCAHGDRRVRQTIIDWAPPHRYAFSSPMPAGLTMLGTFRLQPEGAGTRVTLCVGVGRGVKSALMKPVVRRVMNRWFESAFASMDAMALAGH